MQHRGVVEALQAVPGERGLQLDGAAQFAGGQRAGAFGLTAPTSAQTPEPMTRLPSRTRATPTRNSP
ncbi:hypothetical protein, partial [Streptomyces sp. NPDC047014]|uniref:hypothetical protein n=1 Tax=Streptomyces sp. NPDC047014 TaxID=3155736 RepID=UPI0033ED1631